MDGNAIEIRGVGKRFRLGSGRPTTLREAALGRLRRERGEVREIWSLRDVTADIPRGESLGIIGRNGAGKSTLLRLIAGITAPTTGELRTRGRVASILEVGAGFHPDLTGRENVYVNGAILGMRRPEVAARFPEIVAFSGLEEFIDEPIKHYSSGMYMRLAFSVIAHVEADILLVDEALAVGDAAFRARCLAHMEAIAKGGSTVVFVSHDLDAFTRLCRRGIWLEKGRLMADGPADEVARRYLDEVDDEYLESAEFPESPLAPARVSGVRIVSVDGTQTLDYIGYGTGFQVEVDVEVREPVIDVDLGIRMLTQSRVQVVHESLRHVAPETADALEQPGRYRLRMLVPPVLAPETYTIGISLATPTVELGDHPWALRLRVHPEGSDWRDRVVDLVPTWTLEQTRA